MENVFLKMKDFFRYTKNLAKKEIDFQSFLKKTYNCIRFRTILSLVDKFRKKNKIKSSKDKTTK